MLSTLDPKYHTFPVQNNNVPWLLQSQCSLGYSLFSLCNVLSALWNRNSTLLHPMIITCVCVVTRRCCMILPTISDCKFPSYLPAFSFHRVHSLHLSFEHHIFAFLTLPIPVFLHGQLFSHFYPPQYSLAIKKIVGSISATSESFSEAVNNLYICKTKYMKTMQFYLNYSYMCIA